MKILLGMSGGFDSTYSAVKLLSEGHTVEGAILVMHDYTDVSSAKAAAQQIGIPLHVIDCRDAFSNIVEKNFINEYKNARTPNPCIICNREVKFKYLLEYAKQNGFDRIATGHYAKIKVIQLGDEKRYTLVPPRDTKKDQSYMLSRLTQEMLSYLIFPLADEVKEQLRAKAATTDMPAKEKKDSVEICFIPDNNYIGYIEDRLGKFKEGDFIDTDGKTLGKHKGIINYTVGQRKGLGIALGKRMFVTNINKEENTVTLDENARKDRSITISDIVYMGTDALLPCEEVKVDAKVRYTKASVGAVAKCLSDGRIEVIFNKSEGLVCPGQTAVLYVDGAVFASGFID